MVKKVVDISHVVFMELIRTIISTIGVPAAKGSLMRIAINAGEQSEEVEFASFDDFVAAIETLENPIACMEGKAESLGDGLFGLPKCPFASLLSNYTDFYGKAPQGFEAIADEFNKGNPMNKKLRIGSGAGVGPFCVFHQPMRSQAGANIKIGGKKINIFQLGCRTGSGKKAFANEFIEEYGCQYEIVDKALDTYMCCYGVKVLEE